MNEQVIGKLNTEMPNIEKQRFRSPNFPYSTLRDCIELIKKLDASVGTNRVPIEAGVKYMGLSLKSSTTDRIRASIASYGLIVYESVKGEKYLHMTELGRNIVIDKRENSIERLADCRKAMFHDPMMKTVWQEWKRQLPRDDAAIVLILMKNHRFQEEAAKRFTVVIKDNYRFCELENFYEPTEGDNIIQNESVDDERESQKPPIPPTDAKLPKELTAFPIPLENGGLAYIQLPSSVSDEDADYIPEYINLILRKLRRVKQGKNEQEG